MRYIALILYFLSTASSCTPEYIIPQDNTEFMRMSKSCWIDSNKNYTCADMNMYIGLDPDQTSDVKYVCKYAKANNYTNADFASLVNFRLKDYGLTACYVTPINNLGGKQLRDQCPLIYKDHCCSVHVV